LIVYLFHNHLLSMKNLKSVSPYYFAAFIILLSACKKDIIEEKTPVVNAGEDQTLKLPVDSVILSGSATIEGGKITAYLWSEISGPSTPAIKSSGSAVTTVKGLVAGSYVFQLMALDSSGETGVDMVSITVNPNSFQLKYLYLRPGPINGHDVIVVNIAGLTSTTVNFKAGAPELNASEWTYNAIGGGEGTVRALIKFSELGTIPASAIVDSAFINFYGLPASQTAPQGNSYYSGSPYNSFGENKCWLQKVASDWSDTSVTWNTQPAVSSTGQVEMAASSSQFNYNATHLDVTNFVKDMVSTPSQNYGFMLRVQTEVIYRSMIFGSSQYSDSTKRPSLQVYYKQLQ
jgi:Disaggregatase related repeat